MSRRRLAAAATATVVAPIAFALSADAATTATTVTSAPYPARVFSSDTAAVFQGSGYPNFVIKGTANGVAGTDKVVPYCYDKANTPDEAAGSAATIKADGTYTVQLGGGSTTFPVGHVCDIRVVPDGGTTPSGAAVSAFPSAGRAAFAYSGATPPGEGPQGAGPNLGKSFLDIGSFPDTGGTQAYSSPSFGGLGGTPGGGSYLNDGDLDQSGTTATIVASLTPELDPGTSPLGVDGKNTLFPLVVAGLVWSGDPDQPDLPGEAVASTYDPATGNAVVSLSTPLVQCAVPATYPPTKASCATVSPAGVTFTRTMTFSQHGLVQTASDSFASSDGANHAVNVRYLESFGSSGGTADTDPEWAPQGGAFSQPASGAPLPLPGSGPATWTIHTRKGAPSFAYPSATLTTSSLPTTATFTGSDSTSVVMGFTRAVTAESPGVVTHTVTAATTDAEAQGYAATARAATPASIALKPIAGVVGQRTVTLSGTVTGGGNGRPGHVTIGQTTVPVAADGTFTTTVKLSKPNAPAAFVAMGVDSIGTPVASNTITTRWVLPVQGVTVKNASGKVKVTATCATSAVGGCSIPITVTAGGKTVASGTLKLTTGHKGSTSLALNSAGRSKLRAVKLGHNLSLKVVVKSKDPSGLLSSVATKTVKVPRLA